MTRAALVAFALLSALSPLSAQPARPPLEPISLLDAVTRESLRRLAGTGAIPVGEPLFAWPLPGERVSLLLDSAGRADGAASMLAAAASRLRRSGIGAARDGPAAWFEADAGWSAWHDRLRAGRSTREPLGYRGAVHLADETTPAWRFAFAVRPARPMLVAVEVRDTTGRPRVEAAYLATRLGGVNIRAGRQPLSFGMGHGGGLVLHSPPPFDGLHIDIAEGFHLPWALRYAGRVRIAQLVARMDRSGDIEDPWFAATRITFEPFASLTIGFQRAIILAGEGNDPVTGRRLLLALLGVTDAEGKDSDFENNVVSGDLLWKLPGAPASVHVEWSFDDAGAAFHKVPAFIAGADWHVLPFAPALGIGVETVIMTPSVAAHPPWYQHIALGDGWTDAGHPLGHPLGGHGREVALVVNALHARAGTATRLFWRDRGDENLFAPDREGRSLGVGTEGRLWLAGPVHARWRVDAEHHTIAGWSWSGVVTAGVSTRF